MLGNATSSDDLDAILEEYGITRGDDGTFSGDYYDSLDDESKKQFATLYRLYENSLSGSSNAVKNAIGSESTGYDFDSLGNLVAGTNDDMTLSAEYAYEYNRLRKMVESGDLDESGTMIELKRGNNQGEGPKYLYYYKGKFYVTSDSKYSSYSGKRYTITNHESKETTSGGDNA